MVIGNKLERITLALRDLNLRQHHAEHPEKVDPEADLYGAASTSGIAEGVARLALKPEDFQQVKQGEIVVASMISPAESYVFNYAAAIVCDGGGLTSHPMIVAREYGIPCIIGTMEATKKIRNGMKIRVDGTRGCIYFLDKIQ